MKIVGPLGAFLVGALAACGVAAILLLARHPLLRFAATEAARQDVAAFDRGGR
jgi:hypothetical protein